ncbi:FecCD family ABC transporter permease [Paenibacillus sp. MMS18-CY102]|uniref:FecCD family ABC transporter permease n=1 Tax=Paenibacillus sp. MMS18-CY102 TaxID=2682849 RepID=UPI0013662230|nr:iron ABC transporter permease [Paenibacillus sp. MMS18-CY102]MWC26929.1 iron chelate uptake ABC transporter family permease subunit [Paenibacillus sp. MMS18-CY102]
MEAINRFAVERRRRKRGIIVMSILGALIITSFMISMNTGYIRMSPMNVIRTLFGMGSSKDNLILFDFRLPRIVISLLIGAGLAVSGCILQGVSRNALADPGILGINAGAGLVVTLYVAFYSSAGSTGVFVLPVLAMIGAGLTAFVIYSLAYKRNEGISPTSLILTGIAVAAGISSVMIVITLRISPEQYQFVQTWLIGSVWGTNWKFVLALLPWIVILIPYTMMRANVLNILNLSEQTAAGLGAPIERSRRVLLAVAVGLAGSCVSVSGGIGFVGLIGPHLARRLVGPKHQLLIPTSALVGALLTIVADMIGRSILPTQEIPIGVVVAVIGAPYFLYLLARSKA